MNLYEFLLLGILAGISPGPITALMLGETFKHGMKQGLKVPLALIVSNIFFGFGTVSLLSLGLQVDGFLKGLTMVGALVLVYFGIQEWRASAELRIDHNPRPFQKALFIEVSNPHPYVFWITLLAPSILLIEMTHMPIAWSLFVAGLVGTKTLLVLMAHFLRPYLRPKYIKWLNRFLAVALIAFGVKLLIG